MDCATTDLLKQNPTSPLETGQRSDSEEERESFCRDVITDKLQEFLNLYWRTEDESSSRLAFRSEALAVLLSEMADPRRSNSATPSAVRNLAYFFRNCVQLARKKQKVAGEKRKSLQSAWVRETGT